MFLNKSQSKPPETSSGQAALPTKGHKLKLSAKVIEIIKSSD